MLSFSLYNKYDLFMKLVYKFFKIKSNESYLAMVCAFIVILPLINEVRVGIHKHRKSRSKYLYYRLDALIIENISINIHFKNN